MFTVANVAEILWAADPGGRPAAYFAGQVRRWARAGLLDFAGLRGAGRTAAREFDEDTIYRAWLFSELTALGLDTEQLRPVAGAVQTIPARPGWAADELWAAAKAGETAFLVLHAARGHILHAELSRTPGLPPEGTGGAPAVLNVHLGRLFAELTARASPEPSARPSPESSTSGSKPCKP